MTCPTCRLHLQADQTEPVRDSLARHLLDHAAPRPAQDADRFRPTSLPGRPGASHSEGRVPINGGGAPPSPPAWVRRMREGRKAIGGVV